MNDQQMNQRLDALEVLLMELKQSLGPLKQLKQALDRVDAKLKDLEEETTKWPRNTGKR